MLEASPVAIRDGACAVREDPMPSVERLKRRLAETLKARKFDAALGALRLLANEEPNEPSWHRRAAQLFHVRSDTRAELAALRRALELQVDQGRVLEAIASCKSILEIAPNDEQTLDTMDLLYLEDGAGSSLGSSDAAASSRPKTAADANRDAPLEDLVLTDVVPGARSIQRGEAAPGSINEIPIDGSSSDAGAESSSPTEPGLDLHLDRWSSSADLMDVAAAQAACLPASGRSESPNIGSQSTGRGASLRSELANVPLFGDLDPASLHTLIRRVRVVMLEAGQVLFREGDPANSLYVVVDGAVVPIAEGERRRKLAVLERGEFFGEIGLMTKQPRNATIEALVETKLLAIDRRLVWELIENQSSVAQGILRFLRARLIDRQIRTNLFFSAFAHAEREAVARQFRFIEVDADTRLIERGDAPDGLFVVLSGSLAVLGEPRSSDSADLKELATLGLGDVFGGLSLIEGKPSEVDVTTRTKCWLVVLGEGRFRRILASNPRLDRVLRRIGQQSAAGSSEGAKAIAL